MKPSALYESRIIRIRKKAEFVGYVQAPDEQAAIELAAKTYGIPAALQDRLVAHRVTR
jgi:hypothetical protein